MRELIFGTWCLLLHMTSGQLTSFLFTPDELESTFGTVSEIRDDIDTSSGSWRIDGNTNQEPITMALRTTMLAGENCEVNKFTVDYDARHTSAEGDSAIIISAGNQYLSFMFDFDGGVAIGGSIPAGGIGIWPPCGAYTFPEIPYNSSDPTTLFNDELDLNPSEDTSFHNWRDRMAGGTRNNWSPLSNTRVGNRGNTGFKIGFEMLDVGTNNASTLIEFTSGNYYASCIIDDVFNFELSKDIIVDYSPDYNTGERWFIDGINVTTDCSDYTPCGVSESKLPEPCNTNPCNCSEKVSDDPEIGIYSVGRCIMNTCHANGCDQCENGYFKKYYNYPCIGCNDTFGSSCMHCTDFLGCQQCKQGSLRLFDENSGFWYCETRDECINPPTPYPTPPTTAPVEDATTYFPQDPDITTTNFIVETDPAPEKPTSDPTPNPITPEFTTTAQSIADFASFPTTQPTILPTLCDNNDEGYFEITSISIDAFNEILGKYYENDLGSTGGEDSVPIYENSNGVTAYKSGGTFGTYTIETSDGLTYFYITGVDNINGLVGTNSFEIGGAGGEGSIDITIDVYDCDGNLITVSDDTCIYDCIEISGSELDATEFGAIPGGVTALNGEYCYNGNLYEYVDSVNSYFVQLTIDDLSGTIEFFYSTFGGIPTFTITFSEVYDSLTYGNFACQDVIDSFFNDNVDGTWIVASDDLEGAAATTLVSDPQFTFNDCLGNDFWCGVAPTNVSSARKGIIQYVYISIISVILAVLFILH